MPIRPIRFVRLALMCAAAAGCSAPSFSLEPSYGRLDARGDVALTQPGQPEARNSFDGLGLSGSESTLGLRADFKWGIPHLTLATQSAKWSGEGVASDFGDIGGVDVAVDSTSRLGFHRALVTFDLLPGSMFDLGLGLGISAIDIDARVVDRTLGQREEIDELLPVPVLALRLGLDIWRIQLEGLLSGIAVQIDGDKASYFDMDLAARTRLIEAGPVEALFSVGYRRIQLDVEYEDDGDSGELDLVIDGLYAGLRFSF